MCPSLDQQSGQTRVDLIGMKLTLGGEEDCLDPVLSRELILVCPFCNVDMSTQQVDKFEKLEEGYRGAPGGGVG
jgi:hypothetical protein